MKQEWCLIILALQFSVYCVNHADFVIHIYIPAVFSETKSKHLQLR